MGWTQCSTIGEFLHHGLIQSVGYHVVAVAVLVFWTAIGDTSPVAFVSFGSACPSPFTECFCAVALSSLFLSICFRTGVPPFAVDILNTLRSAFVIYQSATRPLHASHHPTCSLSATRCVPTNSTSAPALPVHEHCPDTSRTAILP